MDSLFSLIKIGVILALLGAAWYAVDTAWEDHIANPYRDEGRQEQWGVDEPVIKTKDAALLEANASNTAREGELASCAAEADKQTKSIKDAADADKVAKAETDRLRKELAASNGQYQTTVDQLIATAHAAQTGKETCASELKEIDTMVRDARRKRMRAITAEPDPSSTH